MKSVIYYFTGSGNSLKVAKDIAERIDAQLVKICADHIEQDSTPYEKVGFVFPVYFAGAPLMVKEFVKRLKLSENAYVFAVATYGGREDASIWQIDDLLEQKNIKLSAGFAFQMPGSYQVMYAPYSAEVQKKHFEGEKKAVDQIADCINRNEVIPYKVKKASIKIANLIHNKFFKPYNKDENFWVDEKCNSCGICEKVCPSNNIHMSQGKPEWQHQCEQCLACMQWCPKMSIQYKKATINRGRYQHPEIKVTELFRQ